MKNRIVVLIIILMTVAFVELFAQTPEDSIHAYPVPFNPRKFTQLHINGDAGKFPGLSSVKVNVYDVNGDKCFSRTYSNFLSAKWNGRNNSGSTVAPGLYIIKVEVEDTNGYYGKKILRILIRY